MPSIWSARSGDYREALSRAHDLAGLGRALGRAASSAPILWGSSLPLKGQRSRRFSGARPRGFDLLPAFCKHPKRFSPERRPFGPQAAPKQFWCLVARATVLTPEGSVASRSGARLRRAADAQFILGLGPTFSPLQPSHE